MNVPMASQHTGSTIDRRSLVSLVAVCFLPLILALNGFSACTFLNTGRTVYDQEGVRIGLEADPSVRQSTQAGLNNHPIDLTSKDLESLLQPIQVSGYSGTITGLITKPQPVPLFTPKELSTISEHLAKALREARPDERVSFSLPKPDVTYSDERTVGFLFFRGSYLHVVVTDHSSIIRTDTGGGEYRDSRDTKGMNLSVGGPIQAAMVPGSEEPRWEHFERVHISLDVKTVLAHQVSIPSGRRNQKRTGLPVLLPATTSSESGQSSTSSDDLQLQLRDLSGANQELRDRLEEQNKRMEQLQDQVEQLRRELPTSDLKSQPHDAAPDP